MNRISFFGLGYVGLTTAACFASKGFKVTCFDTDQERLHLVEKGRSPFHEPRLSGLLAKSVRHGFLKCLSDSLEAVRDSDATFITVGTPSKPDGGIDLAQVQEASIEVGKAVHEKNKWHLVVVKSTVVPGTTENMVKPTLEGHSDKTLGPGFGLCSNPEFLREGSAVRDTLNPDRLIIGECDKKSGNALERLYRSFHGHLPPMIRTAPVNAEIIKYANNAFLAMKISFINMIANLCQRLPRADVQIVAQGIGLDKRVGSLFLRAGAGWGGSCFEKDLTALDTYARSLGESLPLVSATLAINNEQPLKTVELAKQLLGNLHSRQIAVLGLAFKPETDDMRNAVSIKVINKLLEEGTAVVAYDPLAVENAKKIFRDRISYAVSTEECLRDAECTIILTEWNEFRKLRLKTISRLMTNPVIVDGRRILDPKLFHGKIKTIGVGEQD